MTPLFNAKNLSKTYGHEPLFQNISFVVNEGARIGLIGPNGSGKSTLLEILAGTKEPDSGELAVRKGTKLCYVAQDSQFAPGDTVTSIVEKAKPPEDVNTNEILGRAGFTDFESDVSSFSGGWKKRLAIVQALVQKPDLLLLDEPTNHLDLAGIEWLEGVLESSASASIVVSHDRYFLENVTTEMVELNTAYAEGLLEFSGNYSTFLEKKAEYLHAQAKRQESLENRVRNEMEWLRRGPKARTTKSKARIDRAHELIGELADLQGRSRTYSAGIDFSSTDRKTKRLIEAEKVKYSVGGRVLFEDLNLVVMPGTRVGLVGPNGSGKTTLLRLLVGEWEAESGSIKRADALRVVYFEQARQMDPNVSLKRALAPDGDSVIFRDRVIHVNSWAARFLFAAEQLQQPVGRLSGGERARVLIARLMLEPADVLLLDEPTNDLDIPTLEILEENLLDFPGAMILVTHDRYLLDRVSNVVVGLDGEGGCGLFADYLQWEAWQAERKKAKSKPVVSSTSGATPAASASKKKLSYKDAREYETLEQRIADAEHVLEVKRAAMQDPAIVSDGAALQRTYKEFGEAQQAVDALYARWAELEDKLR